MTDFPTIPHVGTTQEFLAELEGKLHGDGTYHVTPELMHWLIDHFPAA